DKEGNRTAGPPVRALDRYRFSIVNGRLILGGRFNVKKVEGEGADAVIKTDRLTQTGDHIGDLESSIYPIPAPHCWRRNRRASRSRPWSCTRSTGWRSALASSAGSSTSSSARCRATRTGSTRSARRR